MKRKTIATVLGAALLPFVVSAAIAGCEGCSGDETDVEPLDIEPAQTAEPVVDIQPEQDAGEDADAADADDADSGKTKKNWGDPTGLAACCAALWHNSKTAPLQYKGAYQAAGASCDAARRSGQGRGALVGIRRLLLGAGMPSACR